MNSLLRFVSIVGLTSVFALGTAMAQKPEQNPQKMPLNEKAIFNYMDKNGDGMISWDEFDQARQARKNHRNQEDTYQTRTHHSSNWGGHDNNDHGNSPRHNQRNNAARQEQRQRWINVMFNRVDRNEDGVVSKGEFLISAERLFDHLDKNKDGLLQKSELNHKDR